MVGETERVAKTNEFVDGSWNIYDNGKPVPRITTNIFRCRNNNDVFSFSITYNRVCNKSSTKGATTGVGTAHPSGAVQFTPSL